jgi:hypothetical protein
MENLSNKIHKPIVSEKKKIEMESLKERTKHPVKEGVKIPSSASYNDLYNKNGDHPWNLISQNLGHSTISAFSQNRFTTPKNKLSQHSKLAIKSNQKI